MEDIAAGLDVGISIRTLDAADAFLVRVGLLGSIVVSGRLARCEQRFAIAHELGHWRLHGMQSELFFCSTAELRDYHRSAAEIEANTFAGELLAPRAMIDPKLVAARPVGVLRELSATFRIPLPLAAVRLAELTDNPTVAVFSRLGQIESWRPNEAFRRAAFRLRSHRLARSTAAFRVATGKLAAPAVRRVDLAAWFDPASIGASKLSVCEIADVDLNAGIVVSVLWISRTVEETNIDHL